jgi:hypothetical protein
MKKRNRVGLKAFIWIFMIAALVSCRREDPHGLRRLEGKWSANMQGTEWIETWNTLSLQPYTISGSGKELQYGGEKPVEEMTIAEKDGQLVYTVKAAGQNNEAPVDFRLTSSDDKTLRFENPDHDFPQYIEYQFIDDAHIIAKIGKLGSDSEEYIFDFSKEN